MKFTKFGKALVMTALSAGVILGVTSCVQSYTVGYLYVTGRTTAGTGNNGIISGFKIDHNKGGLRPIDGLPISTGGSNPIRAVLLSGGRFLYVLNQGKNCSQTTPCQSAITLFAIGGNGVLSQQGSIYSPQGLNSVRMLTDSAGTFLYVLDQIAPSGTGCAQALGTGVASCGDISVFKIDQNTGRLTTVINAQVTAANGSPLPYFPVPANPIDFVLSGSFVLTLSGTSSTGDSVFPYSYSALNGQLSISQNGVQPLNIFAGTAIVSAGGTIYVLDAETTTGIPPGSTTAVTAPSGILPFTVGSNGALQTATGGTVVGDTTLTNPIYLVEENKGKWVYVVYQGSNNTSTGAQASGVAGWTVDPSTKILHPEIPGAPWGTGSGPQCLLEDPSFQYFYTANFNDSTVTGKRLDVQAGVLNNLNGSANKNYSLPGPGTWCVATGRTS